MNKKEENKIYKRLKSMTGTSVASVLLCISLFACTTQDVHAPDAREDEIAEQTTQQDDEPVFSPEPESVNPIGFEEKTISVNGRENRVFILTIDISDENVSVFPYLSFGRIYGFETLGDMAESSGAYAAVNGGFFFEYGRPSGLVVIDGETISPGTGKFESLVIEDGNARFETIGSKAVLVIGNERIIMDRYNEPATAEENALFSYAYGSTDRLGYERNAIVIKDGMASVYKSRESGVKIPEGGYVVSLPVKYGDAGKYDGMECSVEISPEFKSGAAAYECASMLVKDGKSMAGDLMPWVGNMNHYDPRTCVGIMTDGRVGFVVIDGRQEGYSSGTTGRETADLLITLGFTDAVMLDGGASSQMIYLGETVNSPSASGTQRLLAGGFMIVLKGNAE
ncbi:MAG: phosphodiester glycosidase family protein [Clostridia bacterium]|nr:phosphodiester glycosidase family protein [Clostridia bacterium]